MSRSAALSPGVSVLGALVYGVPPFAAALLGGPGVGVGIVLGEVVGSAWALWLVVHLDRPR